MSAPNLVDVLLAEVDRLTPDQRDAAAERLAELLAPKLAGTLTTAVPEPDGWCDTKGAARYLAISLNALHKLTASRAIPFEQDGPGCALLVQTIGSRRVEAGANIRPQPKRSQGGKLTCCRPSTPGARKP